MEAICLGFFFDNFFFLFLLINSSSLVWLIIIILIIVAINIISSYYKILPNLKTLGNKFILEIFLKQFKHKDCKCLWEVDFIDELSISVTLSLVSNAILFSSLYREMAHYLFLAYIAIDIIIIIIFFCLLPPKCVCLEDYSAVRRFLEY